MASVDYTKFTYDDVLGDLKTLASGAEQYYSPNGDEIDAANKQALDFFRSSTGYIVASMLAHTCDVNNYYIKKAFMETFGETSSSRKAKLIYARDHGYSIKRPMPAEMTYEPIVTGTIKYVSGSMTITVPAKTAFTINGVSLIAKYTCKWNMDESGRITIADGFQGKNVLMEGAIVTRTFYGDGSTFLRYTIEDTGFSDLFGDRDPNGTFISEQQSDGALSVDNDGRVTTISVNGTVWNIDRRTMATSNKNTCLVRTDNNDYIELRFGDGTISNTPSGTILVSYLTTNGSDGNVANITDLEITVSNVNAPQTGNWFVDGKTILKFIADSDLTNGTDAQSDNSIIYSAQSSFSSFDRNVSLSDHQAYMSGLAPSIQYSDVYGEEQIVKWASNAANAANRIRPGNIYTQMANEGIQDSFRYANCMMFVALKNLYKVSGNSYTITSPNEYRLTGYSDKHITSQFYNEFISAPLSYNNIPYSGEVGILRDGLSSRGMVTTSYLYSMPKVHKYTLDYSISVESSYSIAAIEQSTNNAIYNYLIDDTAFCTPVRRSDIIAAIMSVKGVNNCIIKSISPSSICSIPLPIYVNKGSIRTGSAQAGMFNDNYINESLNNGYSVSMYMDLCSKVAVAYRNVIGTIERDVVGTDLYANVSSMSAYTANLPGSSSDSPALNPSQASYYNSLITYSAYTGDGTSNVPSTLDEMSNIYDEYIVSKVVKSMFNTMVAPFISPDGGNGYAPRSIYDLYNGTKNGTTSDRNTSLGYILDVYAQFINWAAAFRIDTNYYTANGVVDTYGDLSNFKGSHEIIQIDIKTPGIY